MNNFYIINEWGYSITKSINEKLRTIYQIYWHIELYIYIYIYIYILKYLIVHTTKPLLSSGIIYQNLWELSLTRHLILQPLVNVTPYHSHFLRPNFVLISKHTYSASHTHVNLLFPARTDHIDLYLNNDLNHIWRAGNISGYFGLLFYGRHINSNLTYLLIFIIWMVQYCIRIFARCRIEHNYQCLSLDGSDE